MTFLLLSSKWGSTTRVDLLRAAFLFISDEEGRLLGLGLSGVLGDGELAPPALARMGLGSSGSESNDAVLTID